MTEKKANVSIVSKKEILLKDPTLKDIFTRKQKNKSYK